MSHIYVDQALNRLEDMVEKVADLIQEERYEDAHEYLEVHVIGDAEELMDELESLEDFQDGY